MFGTKSSKSGQERKGLVCVFTSFLTAIGKVYEVYQVCYTRYEASFYLQWIGYVLKYCKVPKYYDQDCRQFTKAPLAISYFGSSCYERCLRSWYMLGKKL